MADKPGDEPPTEEPKYDQKFFLELAAKGKDAWNAWRRDPANTYQRVTFAGVDFSQAPLDSNFFSGFEFGDFACFDGVNFGFAAVFDGAVFGDYASFNRAAFPSHARFDGAAFGHDARFVGAAFDDKASFAGAAFGHGALFDGAAFGHEASFAGAAFGDFAHFDGARFKGFVSFNGRTVEELIRDLDLIPDADGKINGAQMEQRKRLEASWDAHGSGPNRFVEISFSRARFDGANFARRSFESNANFTNARFYQPPDFEATASAAKIDFTGVHIVMFPLAVSCIGLVNPMFPLGCAGFEN